MDSQFDRSRMYVTPQLTGYNAGEHLGFDTVQNLNVIIAQPMAVPPLHKNSVASRWSKITCASLGLYAFAGGLLSFVGWAADIPRLASWGQNGVTIQPNTTIAVMAAGAALVLLVFGFRRAAAALGVFVALIGSSFSNISQALISELILSSCSDEVGAERA